MLVVSGGKVKIVYHGGHRGHGVNLREQVAGSEEGFAEMAGDNFFFVANRGEIDAGVPAEKYIDVRRYMFELDFGEDGRNSRFLTGPSALFGMTRVWVGG